MWKDLKHSKFKRSLWLPWAMLVGLNLFASLLIDHFMMPRSTAGAAVLLALGLVAAAVGVRSAANVVRGLRTAKWALRFLGLLSICGSLVLGVLGIAFAGSSIDFFVTHDERQITAAYRRFGRAWEHGDYKTLQRLLTPSYTANRIGYPQKSRDESIAWLKDEAGISVVPPSVQLEIVKLDILGSRANAQVSAIARCQRTDIKGTIHSVVFTQQYEDHWTKSGEGWQLATTYYPGPPKAFLVDEKPMSPADYHSLFGR